MTGIATQARHRLTDASTRRTSEPASAMLIAGCMFAGKTTTLFRYLDLLDGQNVLLFKHVIDRRYRDDQVVSHSGKSCPAVSIPSSQAILSNLQDDTDFIALDEAHFFDLDLIDVVERVTSRGVGVLLTALDRDSWGQPFPLIERLSRIAGDVQKLFASCSQCNAPADRTQRLTPIINGNMVGGPESYEPRCRNCWHPPVQPPPQSRHPARR